MSETQRKPKNEMPVEEIQEVADFLEADQELEDFIEQHRDVWQRVRELAEQRNTKLEAAASVVRGQNVTCGPFVKLSETLKVDAEKFFEEVGDQNFSNLGGYTETVVTYKVDRERFKAAVARNDIPKEIVDACTKVELRYKAPEKYKMP